MKKKKKSILLLITGLMIIPLVFSCKKGEEDPWFSFYSRKSRLCQNLKIVSYKHSVQVNDSITNYTFDGSTWVKTKSLNYAYRSPGTMRIAFYKSGTYLWEETVSTDTSNYKYSEKGNWYFTGGGKDTETKYKELVALQRTESTETGNVISTISYKGSGDLPVNVYRLRKLASDEVILESEVKTSVVTTSGTLLTINKTEIILKP